MESKGSSVRRTIALEEHFSAPAELSKDQHEGSLPHGGSSAAYYSEFVRKLADLGEIRISDMDAAGIDVQVLSLTSPGTEQMEPADAVNFARSVNDFVAKAIERHPSRLAAFAALPTSAPDKAADELERTVQGYGFRGAVINGHSRGRYLDDKFFWPILERAEDLSVPIYIHPTVPPRPVVDAYYAGQFSQDIIFALSTSGWGWHIETAVHVIRLILSGAFDRYPKLQIIIGHLGEAIPFMMDRMDRRFSMELTKLDRPISSYLCENFSYTISGFNFTPAFLNLLLKVGVERIMFSTDYPYSSMNEAREFLERLPVSHADREKIAHTNAERLMCF
ncbi:MAG: amidohydrolase [Nitrososphaerota archaeon]|nr:amidohydrolase [Nitrososphaerota archaeon]MDG7051907.1 amidohydrolase [Nitrososphaerota archaeon]